MREFVAARKIGRCANGFERDGGRVFHAVLEGAWFDEALCGAKPGRKRGNGWSDTDLLQDITCPRCLRKLYAIGYYRKVSEAIVIPNEGA